MRSEPRAMRTEVLLQVHHAHVRPGVPPGVRKSNMSDALLWGRHDYHIIYDYISYGNHDHYIIYDYISYDIHD